MQKIHSVGSVASLATLHGTLRLRSTTQAPQPRDRQFSPAEQRLTRAGWRRSNDGHFSRWFSKTAKQPGWALYMVSLALAEVVQDYLDQAKAKRRIRTDELDSRPRPTELSERNFESSNWRAATVQSRELREKGSEARHQPDAQCPKFLQFLKQVTSKNAALAGYVQRDLGYSMTAYTIEKSAFLLHGPTDTSKSTLLALFRKLLGEYAVLIPDRHADGKAGHQQHCC